MSTESQWFDSYFGHLLAVWPLLTHLLSIVLSLLICEIEVSAINELRNISCPFSPKPIVRCKSSLEKKEGNSKNLLLQENFFARSEEPKTAKGYINHAFSSPLGSFESNKVQAKIRCGRVESGEN